MADTVQTPMQRLASKIVDLRTLTQSIEDDVALLMQGAPLEVDYLVFDWPMGDDRTDHTHVPVGWVDATGYAKPYQNPPGKIVFHTGNDWNCNTPKFDSDAHAAVYAAANGVVKFAAALPVWMNVIVIEHTLPAGSEHAKIWTRYAHVENMKVKAGDSVVRGQQIANVGNANGTMPYHLHYDVAVIDLGVKPADWPGNDEPRVLRSYLDPIKFTLTQI